VNIIGGSPEEQIKNDLQVLLAGKEYEEFLNKRYVFQAIR